MPRGQAPCPGPSLRSSGAHWPAIGVAVQHVSSPRMLPIPPHSSPMPPCLAPLRSLPSTPTLSSPTPKPQLTPQLDCSVTPPPPTPTAGSPVQQASPTASPAQLWPLLPPLTHQRMAVWRLRNLRASQGSRTAVYTATAPWLPHLHPACRRSSGSTTRQKTWWFPTVL